MRIGMSKSYRFIKSRRTRIVQRSIKSRWNPSRKSLRNSWRAMSDKTRKGHVTFCEIVTPIAGITFNWVKMCRASILLQISQRRPDHVWNGRGNICHGNIYQKLPWRVNWWQYIPFCTPCCPRKKWIHEKNNFFVKRKIALFQLPKEFYHSFHMAALFLRLPHL